MPWQRADGADGGAIGFSVEASDSDCEERSAWAHCRSPAQTLASLQTTGDSEGWASARPSQGGSPTRLRFALSSQRFGDTTLRPFSPSAAGRPTSADDNICRGRGRTASPPSPRGVLTRRPMDFSNRDTRRRSPQPQREHFVGQTVRSDSSDDWQERAELLDRDGSADGLPNGQPRAKVSVESRGLRANFEGTEAGTRRLLTELFAHNLGRDAVGGSVDSLVDVEVKEREPQRRKPTAWVVRLDDSPSASRPPMPRQRPSPMRSPRLAQDRRALSTDDALDDHSAEEKEVASDVSAYDIRWRSDAHEERRPQAVHHAVKEGLQASEPEMPMARWKKPIQHSPPVEWRRYSWEEWNEGLDQALAELDEVALSDEGPEAETSDDASWHAVSRAKDRLWNEMTGLRGTGVGRQCGSPAWSPRGHPPGRQEIIAEGLAQALQRLDREVRQLADALGGGSPAHHGHRRGGWRGGRA